VKSNAQASHGDGVAAFAATPEVFCIGVVQNIANAFQALFRPLLLRHGHFLCLHGIDAAQSALLSLVELHRLGCVGHRIDEFDELTLQFTKRIHDSISVFWRVCIHHVVLWSPVCRSVGYNVLVEIFIDLSFVSDKGRSMTATILIIEDEPDLIRTVSYNLLKEGFATRTAETGAIGLDLAFQEPIPDLVLLDLMLPDTSGTEVCRKLRADSRTAGVPVIMVTARGEEVDRVVGFEVGADDYVVKPFSFRELLLRIRAVLRRSAAAEEESEQLRFGLLTIDEAGHRVWVGENEVVLTALEFRLLTAFLARKGRAQSREQLLDDVWGMHAGITTRTVDVHIKRLRTKLAEAGEYIETVRGIGYRFRSRVDGGVR
jgi:two-component system phosphate regulon response regulator PhoB